MKKYIKIVGVLFLGLLVAQIIATIQVYSSNVHLHSTLVAIKEAGYFPMPSERFMPNLRELGPAILGGLFFTLSVGSALTFISLAVALFYVHLLNRNKIYLIPIFILWLVVIFMVNHRGLCPMETLYFLIIPPVVFTGAMKWTSLHLAQTAPLTRIVNIIPPFLLALLWATQSHTPLFLEFRDNLLLANSWGTKLNNFYYANTLYPAEIFKSLDQKILKTVDLGQIGKQPVARAMERVLVNYDYLNVGGEGRVDLRIVEEKNSYIFMNRGKIILRTPLKAFLSNPGKVLTDFSSKSDRYGFFRQFTLFSLLIGLPLSLYLLLHVFFCLLARPFFSLKRSSIIASVLCFLLGFSVWLAYVNLKGERIEKGELKAALESEDWRRRVSALKTIVHSKMEIVDYTNFKRHGRSSHLPERFWLVGALGVSRQPETYNEILPFLDDANPSVRRMALHALGQRGNRVAIPEIIKRIETSDRWFSQWYGYKALRALGWKQVKASN